jgi:hypothetical protein
MHQANHVNLRNIVRWLVAGAFTTMCAIAAAQPRYGLSPEVSAVFNRWVLATCIGDEERKLTEDLRRHSEPLTVAFRKAIVEGPPRDELRTARAAAEARYAVRAKFPIQDYRIEGVSEKDLAAFGRVSRQSYVDDQVQRFATGYRANAVAGLGVVGGPGAREVLTRIANNRNDPLALAAREAIKAADQR